MITTKKKITNVNFATTDKGTISIGVKSSLNAILLQQLLPDVNKTIGNKLTDDEIQDLPKVYLNFTKEESIDVLIKALQDLKFHMKYPYGTLVLAC